MKFEELRDFVQNRMQMSHVYQPLLIEALIDSGGVATVRQLAMSFVLSDESQVLYYEKRLKEMPIRVLKNRGVVSKDGELVKLNAPKLGFRQRAELKRLCQDRRHEFMEKRGLRIWDHRLADEEQVPDPLRFRILMEADRRCALCGATKDDRPLDIDHIVPRSKGGKTVYENLQVLCSKCNRTKGNKDRTDFRGTRVAEPDASCPFCAAPAKRKVVAENDLAFVIRDKYPVTRGHSLIVPRRHFADPFQTVEVEWTAFRDLMTVTRKQLSERDAKIAGFNVGFNSGDVAGQTVPHCHLHLIPRRRGDIEDPRGGVRGVIPTKRVY